ncbi:MAG: sialidase family protein [Flavobacteriaceae bacterium]
MKPLHFLLLFLIASCSTKQTINPKTTDKTKISFSENIKIYEQSSFSYGPCEPSIYINPKNTNNIVAGSIMDNVHYSFDAGRTWESKRLKSKLGVYGDPCITADYKGNFYYFHLSNPDGGAGWGTKRFLDRMVVQKSSDGGISWTDGVGIGKHEQPKQQDKEWAIVNPFNNDIYLTWTEFDKYGSKDTNHKSRILFSKSSDQGKTWSNTTTLSEIEGNAIDNSKTVEGAVPAVGINGEIYVAWSLNEQIYFDKSSDQGKTWLTKDIVASNQPKGWDFNVPGFSRVNGMPVTAVDLSKNQHKGTIYINFSDQRNGTDDTDIFIVKSTDNGNTWSQPLRVNKDKTKTHQFFTWMSVDAKTGYVYIVYYDRSKYKDTQTDVVLAVSKDGGSIFTNTTISEKPFTPNPGVFFGDYNNISAYNGVIRPIWTAYYNNKLSVWTSLIEDK